MATGSYAGHTNDGFSVDHPDDRSVADDSVVSALSASSAMRARGEEAALAGSITGADAKAAAGGGGGEGQGEGEREREGDEQSKHATAAEAVLAALRAADHKEPEGASASELYLWRVRRVAAELTGRRDWLGSWPGVQWVEAGFLDQREGERIFHAPLRPAEQEKRRLARELMKQRRAVARAARTAESKKQEGKGEEEEEEEEEEDESPFESEPLLLPTLSFKQSQLCKVELRRTRLAQRGRALAKLTR